MNSIITIDEILADPNKIKAMIRARGDSDHIVDLVMNFYAEVGDAYRAMMQSISSANSLPQQLPPEIKLGNRETVRANRKSLEVASDELKRLVNRINNPMHQFPESLRN